jgi:hypothetical protein
VRLKLPKVSKIAIQDAKKVLGQFETQQDFELWLNTSLTDLEQNNANLYGWVSERIKKAGTTKGALTSSKDVALMLAFELLMVLQIVSESEKHNESLDIAKRLLERHFNSEDLPKLKDV